MSGEFKALERTGIGISGRIDRVDDLMFLREIGQVAFRAAGIAALMVGLIILFIIFEPEGLVGVWIRLRDYFRIWPLPYVSE